MVGQAVPTPDQVPATGDPGDDTARRYRYQWTYAATVCCMLLDETQDVVEVFCEHHEDVLIKHHDGTFSGLQVKTRESDQPVWKTTDSIVRDACARFARLEAQFPGQFRAFRFLTNHPLHASRNSQDLRHVLETIRTAPSVGRLPGRIAAFVSRVAAAARCTKEVAFIALRKTFAADDLPKLGDIAARLVSTITTVWVGAGDCSYTSVEQAVRYLVWECGRASSLAHEDVLPAYLPATANPEEAELEARLAAKRIDGPRVLEWLERGLIQIAALDGDLTAFEEPGAGETDLLLKKLDAGGFSAVSCNSALDLRDKADYLGTVWIVKYGHERGLQRHSHVRSLVLSDAAGAFEATKNERGAFGLEMLNELRSQFQRRRVQGDQLFECSNEHLEGFAYSLTSQCQVYWSLDHPWEAE